MATNDTGWSTLISFAGFLPKPRKSQAAARKSAMSGSRAVALDIHVCHCGQIIATYRDGAELARALTANA